MEPTFLALDEVLEIHQQQIEMYGGSQGLRDAGALESAIAMPMATFAGRYLHPTIPAMAAAYLFHITQNHPFLDGNKRAGANAAITFLRINDWSQPAARKSWWTSSWRWPLGMLVSRSSLTSSSDIHTPFRKRSEFVPSRVRS